MDVTRECPGDRKNILDLIDTHQIISSQSNLREVIPYLLKDLFHLIDEYAFEDDGYRLDNDDYTDEDCFMVFDDNNEDC